jgi:hypothetical protein
MPKKAKGKEKRKMRFEECEYDLPTNIDEN